MKERGLSDGFREQLLAAGEGSERYASVLVSDGGTKLADADFRRNQTLPPLAVAPRP